MGKTKTEKIGTDILMLLKKYTDLNSDKVNIKKALLLCEVDRPIQIELSCEIC